MSFAVLYWIKFFGAVISLLLALLYLWDFTAVALSGFAIIGFVGGVLGYRINKGTLGAHCDLCGNKGLLSAEYGHGFSNARLVLTCEKCGRVVNKAAHGVKAGRENNT